MIGRYRSMGARFFCRNEDVDREKRLLRLARCSGGARHRNGQRIGGGSRLITQIGHRRNGAIWGAGELASLRNRARHCGACWALDGRADVALLGVDLHN